MAGGNISEEGVGEPLNPSDQPGPPAEPTAPIAALGPSTMGGNGDHHAGGNDNNAAQVLYANDPASPPETVEPPSPPPPPSPSARDTASPSPSEQALKEDNMEEWSSARAMPDQAFPHVAPWMPHGYWARALPPHSQHAAAAAPAAINDNNDLPRRPAELVLSDEEDEEDEDDDDDVDRKEN